MILIYPQVKRGKTVTIKVLLFPLKTISLQRPFG
jgi:hypothetical protein